MKKKVFIPIFIIIFFALLFAGTQYYLSKQPFRYYYHGILLPVSPARQSIIEMRLAKMMENDMATSASLSFEVEECKKNGRCIICLNSDFFDGALSAS